MKKMKKTIIYLLALMTIGLIACAGLATAFGLGFVNEEQKSTIKQAIEDNNFEAWKSAIIETLTQENFDKLVERHKVISERMKLQNAVRQSIEAGDYDAYKEAVENLSSYILSEEQFNAMVQHYNTTEPRLLGKLGFLGRSGCAGTGVSRHHIPW